MNFHELKNILGEIEKYPGTIKVTPAPIINEGYPSNFNLSFAYHEWTQKEGQKGPNKQYVSFADEMFYTKCQPCIRPQDWRTITENGENKYRYLSYFHMADVSGLIARTNSKHRQEIGAFSIQSLINFFSKIGLKKENIHITYCAGGNVSDLTSGKYTFNKDILSDPFFDEWIKAGITKEKMLPDKTRDTLLSLRNYSRPTPWGYRNEIFYNHNGKMLDIATIEHLCFEPIFDEKMNVIDIVDYKHAFSISAVGIERLLMVLNNLDDLRKIDILKPLYDLVSEEIKEINTVDTDTLIQTIRPIQAIIADGGQWKKLNSRRREIARAFYREIANLLVKHKINDNFLEKLLSLNADLLKNQALKEAIPALRKEINERIKSFSENKHLSEILRNKYKKLLVNQDGF